MVTAMAMGQRRQQQSINCNGNGARGLGQRQLQWQWHCWGTGAAVTVIAMAMAMGHTIDQSCVILQRKTSKRGNGTTAAIDQSMAMGKEDWVTGAGALGQ
jgi:hypothetical protein